MVQAITAFMDFCYIARRSSHTDETLDTMRSSLLRFHCFRKAFCCDGVRKDFNLPRQHALSHYVNGIMLFGSPNGLCSSITESKHISAVKKPWRRSNKSLPLLQILKVNIRMSKLAALRLQYAKRGLLNSSANFKMKKIVNVPSRISAGRNNAAHLHSYMDEDGAEVNGGVDVDDLEEPEPISVQLAKKPSEY
jgi:hypothetical protein